MPIGEIEFHPYLNYLGSNYEYSAFENIIIGSFPIYALTSSNPNLNSKGINIRADWKKYANTKFFYGSKRNHTWRILKKIYAVDDFEPACILKHGNIFMTDMVLSCNRLEYKADDTALKKTTINENVFKNISLKSIKYIYFTSAGLPFYLFKQLLLKENLLDLNSFSPIGDSKNKNLVLNNVEYKIGFLVSPSGNNRFKNNLEYKFNFLSRNPSRSFDEYRIEQWEQLILKKNFEYDGTNPID